MSSIPFPAPEPATMTSLALPPYDWPLHTLPLATILPALRGIFAIHFTSFKARRARLATQRDELSARENTLADRLTSLAARVNRTFSESQPLDKELCVDDAVGYAVDEKQGKIAAEMGAQRTPASASLPPTTTTHITIMILAFAFPLQLLFQNRTCNGTRRNYAHPAPPPQSHTIRPPPLSLPQHVPPPQRYHAPPPLPHSTNHFTKRIEIPYGDSADEVGCGGGKRESDNRRGQVGVAPPSQPPSVSDTATTTTSASISTENASPHAPAPAIYCQPSLTCLTTRSCSIEALRGGYCAATETSGRSDSQEAAGDGAGASRHGEAGDS
ncbi:hypothetical protein V496_07303 [Pseudogymnoascus sp. VKM F-4515 (FW-2607)]|nr:hypothetical protein V496_07303 [Pseudogymnoascus sp. VKM F-4515 (FW-2607)]